jgi:hypothetical protein
VHINIALEVVVDQNRGPVVPGSKPEDDDDRQCDCHDGKGHAHAEAEVIEPSAHLASRFFTELPASP